MPRHPSKRALSAGKPSSRCSQAALRRQVNYRVMETLDPLNRRIWRSLARAAVRVEPRRGKAIVVSGHDLADLHALLEQTTARA